MAKKPVNFGDSIEDADQAEVAPEREPAAEVTVEELEAEADQVEASEVTTAQVEAEAESKAKVGAGRQDKKANAAKPKKGPAVVRKSEKAQSTVPAIDQKKFVNASQIGVHDKRVKVILDEGAENEPGYALLGINGKMMQVQRGVIVELPESFLEVLDHAQGARVVRHIDPHSGKTVEAHRTYQRYPYRIVRD